MGRTVEITGNQLTNALRALDVNFILGGQSTGGTLHKQPARLIAALAKSDESRLRLSLIALFLEHPEFASYVRTAAKKLEASARLTLQCYYTAAVWLGKKYRLHKSLPDYFSQELNLHPVDDLEENLARRGSPTPPRLRPPGLQTYETETFGRLFFCLGRPAFAALRRFFAKNFGKRRKPL